MDIRNKNYYLIFILGIALFPGYETFSQSAELTGGSTDSLFHIQLSASRQIIDAKSLKLDPEIRDLINVMLVGGWYKYYVGNFPTHQSAEEYNNAMKRPGFIASYANGKIIRKGANRFPNVIPTEIRIAESKPVVRSSAAMAPLSSGFSDKLPDKQPVPTDIGKPSGPNAGLFTDDRDGEVYRWVRIGNQIWTAENLRFSSLKKSSATQPNTMTQKYGRLYNFKSAEKACPEGWHLPSDAEWRVMEEAVGLDPQQLLSLGYRENNNAGRSLKSTELWKTDENGYDRYRFSAVPAGMAKKDGSRRDVKESAYFWSSTNNGMAVWVRQLRDNSPGIVRSLISPDQSLSVRCIKTKTS